MSAAKATFETVQAAIAALEGSNRKVTAEAIREELGGGSQGTIIKFLAQSRGSGFQPATDADRVAEQSRKIMNDALAAVSRIERTAACEDFQEVSHSQLETIAKMVKDAQEAAAIIEVKDAVIHDALNRERDMEERNLAITAERDDLGAKLALAREEISTLSALLEEAESTRQPDPMLAQIFSALQALNDRPNQAEN